MIYLLLRTHGLPGQCLSLSLLVKEEVLTWTYEAHSDLASRTSLTSSPTVLPVIHMAPASVSSVLCLDTLPDTLCQTHCLGAFEMVLPCAWNMLPQSVPLVNSLTLFTSLFKYHLLNVTYLKVLF